MTDVAYRIYSLDDKVISIDGTPIPNEGLKIGDMHSYDAAWGIVYDESTNPALGTTIAEDATVPVVVLKRESDGEEYTPTEGGGDVWLGGRPGTWPWLV